jgi:uncharacterized surface anchored protein
MLLAMILSVLPMAGPDPAAALQVDETATPTEIATAEPESSATPTPEPSPTTPPPAVLPTETATSAPEPTLAPEPTKAAATSTTVPSPTAAGAGKIAPAATGYLVINSVDENGLPLPGACFDIYVDAGGGTLGAYVRGICLGAPASVKTSLAAGYYVLREPAHLTGYGRADNKRATVTAGATRTVTVKHYPLSTVVVRSEDNVTHDLINNVCYWLIQDVVYEYPGYLSACDNSDGTVDGIVHITGVDRGSHTLRMTWAAPIYFKPADKHVDVTTLNTNVAATMRLTKSGRVVVSFEDQDGAPLLGACAALFEDAGGGTHDNNVVVQKCDTSPWDETPNDGQVELVGMSPGNYVLSELGWPLGYFPDAKRELAITIANGQTIEHTFVSSPAAVVTARTVDDNGDPLPGACFELHTDAGGGVPGYTIWNQLCDDTGAGGDGSTTIPVFQPGDYVLIQTAVAKGYIRSDPVLFTVPAGDAPMNVPVINRLGGKVVVHLVDEHAATLSGACFSLGPEGFAYFAACDADDGANDGTTTIIGITAGTYQLTNYNMPVDYDWLPTQSVTIALGQTKTFNLAGEPYGTIEIHKKTPGDAALPGACFEAQPAIYQGPFVFQACDESDGTNDGTIAIRAPEGDFSLVETQVPAGYVAVEPSQIHVENNQTVTVAIIDPTPSTAVIHAVDVNDAAVTGFCWRVTTPESITVVSNVCDGDDGTADGITHIATLRGGDYNAVQRTTKSGYLKAAPTPFTIGVMATLDLTVLIPQPTPTIVTGPWILSLTQTAAVISWDTNQKATGVIDYGLTANLGRIRPLTQPAPAMAHQVEISPLKPGTTYFYRIVSTNVNGEVKSEVYSLRTPAATATAQLSVTKTNADKTQILPGACFEVYRDAGNGKQGAYVDGYCDKYDSAPNNGKVLFPALDPGAYILVESRSPAGYSLAARRQFSVAAGQTLRMSVRDSAGGALLTITKRNDAGKPLPGACFTVWTLRNGALGDYVAWASDDYDGNDGTIRIGNLRPGAYWVEETCTPTGYIPADGKQLTIASGQTTAALTFTNYSQTGGDTVELQAIDGTGKLLPGACLALFWSDQVRSACDNSGDGRVFFANVAPGDYTVLEYHAPAGFQVGKRTTFTKVDNRFKRLRFTQVAGGVRVTVTTLKGSTTSALPGACYGLYKQVGSGSWPSVAFWCDEDDGTADGRTRLDGVPAGTYLLVQTYTPPGYATPKNQTITVGTASKAVTVRAYAGATAAGMGGNRMTPSVNPPDSGAMSEPTVAAAIKPMS